MPPHCRRSFCERQEASLPGKVRDAMLSAVNSVASVAGALGAGAAATSPEMAPPASPFADLLADAVGQVNQLEGQAQQAVTGLMTGAGVDVHQAMIATQKADMAFELVLAVRNKAIQAYQSVMGMQF